MLETQDRYHPNQERVSATAIESISYMNFSGKRQEREWLLCTSKPDTSDVFGGQPKFNVQNRLLAQIWKKVSRNNHNMKIWLHLAKVFAITAHLCKYIA